MAQAIPLALAAAGTAVSAVGTIVGAKAEARELNSQADQLDVMAGKDRASSQRASMDQRRQARLLQSRALSIAAAQGGAGDPTVVNILAELEGEGEYRALTALYEGEEQARSREAEARAKRREARNVKRGALFEAGSKILSGGSTMFSRYGQGGVG